MKTRILIKGPLMSRSGYGEQARFALRALRSRPDAVEVYAINTNWGRTGHSLDDTEENDYIRKLLLKTNEYATNGGTFDIAIQVTIPNEFTKIAPINIGYTAGIETTKVAPEWIDKVNNIVDSVIVVSNHSKKVFENTTYQAKDQAGTVVPNWGITKPVNVVNYPVRQVDPEPLNIDLTTENNFLVVSQWGPRKNMPNTIKWFVEKFAEDETAGLIVKTNLSNDSVIDRGNTAKMIESILDGVPDRKCKVYLVHGEVSPAQLTWLYQHPTMKALINIGHGEGYGLPMFEAAYNGLPLITTAWSGQMDFICKPNKKGKMYPRVARVDYDIKNVQKEAVWKGVITEDSSWAFAKEASYKRVLQEVLEKEVHYRKEASALQEYILENFTAEKMYADFVESLGVPLESAGNNIEKMRDSLLQIENPKERATAATAAIGQLTLQSEKLAVLKDLFKGERCYVLSCGPTLTEHDEDAVKGLLQNNLTVAVKQAYDLFASLTDFHVYNCANFKKYDYTQHRPVVMEASTTPYKLGECDLKFFIRERSFDNSVAAKKNFDDWTLDKQAMLRPYGPGIMYEAVFYMLQHLGVSEVTTIGWDNKLVAGGADQQHFYDQEGSLLDKADFIHQNEVAANEAAVQTLSHEENITVGVVGEWYDWLKENGCELKIISRLNPADERIERVEI